jgi:hypothetical protein
LSTTIEARVARLHPLGDALIYEDGIEHRDADELASIVAQLPGVPVRFAHDGPVVGRVQSARLDGRHVVAIMVIDDASAARAIHNGTDAFSLSYRRKLDDRRFQRGIRLDDIAIVEHGRGGYSMRVTKMVPHSTVGADRERLALLACNGKREL